METLTVRINRTSHAKLQKLAKETDEPMVTVLEKAVEELPEKAIPRES